MEEDDEENRRVKIVWQGKMKIRIINAKYICGNKTEGVVCMNAQELFLSNGKSANVWYCSECKIVARGKEAADNCCKRNNCSYCGELVEDKFWLAHKECIEKNKINNAKKLDTWDGWVFYEDKYYTTIDELLDELEDSGEEIPEYVYVCKTIPFPVVKIDRLLEEIEENSYESIGDQLSNLDVLADTINDFNEANKELVSYLPDESKMVKTQRRSQQNCFWGHTQNKEVF